MDASRRTSDADGSYSDFLVAGDLVFVSGQSPVDAGGGLVGETVAEQTAATLANLAAVLERAGLSLRDVVRVNAYLSTMDDFDAYDREYRRHFAHPRPTRTTVGASVDVGVVEIDAIAYAGTTT